MVSPWFTASIVALAYVGIAAGRIPGLKANRATIALLGVGLLLISGQVPFGHLVDLVDTDTIVLLFSMMIINASLRLAGFFEWVGDTTLRLARSPRGLLAVEVLAVGILSALFLNDTICLMFTPLVVDIASRAGRRPVPYLIALATAANVGSMATLTGNPQNMIIGVASGISYTRFALSLAPMALLGLGIVWGVLVTMYPHDFPPGRFAPLMPQARVADVVLLVKSLLVVSALLAAFMAGVSIALASFIAACALLVTRRLQPQDLFAEFDWALLVFFCGLFVLSGTLEASGIATRLFAFLHIDGGVRVWPLSAVTTLLSNLVSNVPAVLLLKPVISAMARPEAGWLTLAASSTLAGNLTLLGSVANLIVAEGAARHRVTLSFWEYTRAGLLITLLTLAFAGIWLGLFTWR